MDLVISMECFGSLQKYIGVRTFLKNQSRIICLASTSAELHLCRGKGHNGITVGTAKETCTEGDTFATFGKLSREPSLGRIKTCSLPGNQGYLAVCPESNPSHPTGASKPTEAIKPTPGSDCFATYSIVCHCRPMRFTFLYPMIGSAGPD